MEQILHAAVESKLDGGLVGALDIWRRCSDQLNINQQNRWLETPLHVASWCSPACVKLLLEAGAALDVQQEDGQVPLHCPGLVRSPESYTIASLLCETNRNDHINVQDVDGRPPLFDFLDDAECVALLIRSGAKLDLIDGCEKTVFHHACAHGESASLQILLENLDDKTVAATKDLNGNTPLLEALSNSHTDCAKLLLILEDVGDIISTEGWAPVHYAAKIGDCDLLEAVLKHSTFMKGMKTIDGKRAETIAMEAGNWKGRIKELLREYDYFR
jgi:ankyrin repeat protein